MPLNITYQGTETVIEDDTIALIGSDVAATIRIVRPGISRKHAVVSFDGTNWKVEDAGSRNGTFIDGQRVQTTVLVGPTTLYLGHATDGEAILFVPVSSVPASSGDSAQDESLQNEIDALVIPSEVVGRDKPEAAQPTERTQRTPVAVERTQVQLAQATNASAVELAALTEALRDQISAVKGLTWSVWGMIAVTAALAVMTLFVGVLGA